MVYISFKRVKGFECEIHRNMKKINKIKKVGSWHPGVKPDQLNPKLAKKTQTGRYIGNDQDGYQIS